jgi:hypothetical protein
VLPASRGRGRFYAWNPIDAGTVAIRAHHDSTQARSDRSRPVHRHDLALPGDTQDGGTERTPDTIRIRSEAVRTPPKWG